MPNLISNLIKKFEFEPNFKVAKFEFEPEPCDIDFNGSIFYKLSNEIAMHLNTLGTLVED